MEQDRRKGNRTALEERVVASPAFQKHSDEVREALRELASVLRHAQRISEETGEPINNVIKSFWRLARKQKGNVEYGPRDC